MHPLDDPSRVSAHARSLLEAMLEDPRPACADAARAALSGLRDGTLAGVVSSSARNALAPRLGGPIAHAASGALFQCFHRRDPPRDGADMPGVVVLADDFAGGSMVLVHELTHYRNRFAVHQLAQQPAPLLRPDLASGLEAWSPRWSRAQLLNEIAARHAAFLAEEGRAPGEGPMPAPGALFACAVKIASYPHVYNDGGYMQRLVATGDLDLLRDQVGAWLSGLPQLVCFEPGRAIERAHRAYLEAESVTARAGRHAPRVDAEGTL